MPILRIDFIVVGAQKAGTSALHEYLASDPNYAVSKTKELHFFDDETRNWSSPDYGRYHAQFDWDRKAIRGETTPIYLYWPQSLERIAAYRPDIRLVVMLRDPVERAWSHWKMERSRGVETGDFSWCIREGRQRLLKAEPWGVHREFSYVERGFYGEQLVRLFDIFPREQVLVLTADTLQAEPGATLDRLNCFLGVPLRGPVAHRAVHVGAPTDAELTTIDVAYLREIYAEDQEVLKALTGVAFAEHK